MEHKHITNIEDQKEYIIEQVFLLYNDHSNTFEDIHDALMEICDELEDCIDCLRLYIEGKS